MDSDSEMKLISLITQLISLEEPMGWGWDLDQDIDLDRAMDWDSEVKQHYIQIITLVRAIDLESQPKPESKLMSLVTQAISVFNSMDLDAQPKPLSNLISILTEETSLFNSREPESESGSESNLELALEHLSRGFQHAFSLHQSLDLGLELPPSLDTTFVTLVNETLSLEPEPELILLIHQIFSLVISMNSKWEKLINLCPRLKVRGVKKEIHLSEQDSSRSRNKWMCLPLYWKTMRSTGEDTTHFFCLGCNGENHENEKAPVEIKHPLHPKHSLKLAELYEGFTTRECYCCEKYLKKIFYYCSACDFAMNIACVEKPPLVAIDHPKWHEHTLALFSRTTSLTCDLCALTDSSHPFYICPPCGFVVHRRCTNLPRVIRISRHRHRISFTPSFDQGDRSCGVCQRKMDNDYGCYSCIKEGCSFAAHSKCATQSNVWDGEELEEVPEEIEEDVDPFVTISEGIIQHFCHPHHHLTLLKSTNRSYDENKLCQACITPIYEGNFYSCMKCDFILHEECAKFSRKIQHPIHPHMLTLGKGNDVMNHRHRCSACPWMCSTGFFYKCNKKECRFKLHVQCATISEPVVHESHGHPLFLTSKPGEERMCSVCKGRKRSEGETFNCLECEFSLCFECATLPRKVRHKHDKHMLTLSYGNETNTMTNWCEACEEKINPKEGFYKCDEYCCVTLHIKCMIGEDLYMKPGSSLFYWGKNVDVLRNNQHMSRPICPCCEKRCPHKIAFQCSGLVFCSLHCLSDCKLSLKESR